MGLSRASTGCGRIGNSQPSGSTSGSARSLPAQLSRIASGLVIAVTNHEYQHSQWIAEVRERDLGHPLPDRPTSDLLTELDGYLVLG